MKGNRLFFAVSGLVHVQTPDSPHLRNLYPPPGKGLDTWHQPTPTGFLKIAKTPFVAQDN